MVAAVIEPLINCFLEGDTALPDGVPAEKIADIARHALVAMKERHVSVSLILTDDQSIHDLNRDYRKKDRPTDVISFAYRENPFPGIEEECEELGDIYISIDTALRQAAEYGVSLHDEIKRLVIHGILHLLGFDHELSPEEEQRMEQKEEELFANL